MLRPLKTNAKESILVTSAGTIVAQGIMKCLRLANASTHGPNYRIIAVDMSPTAAGLYRGDAGVLVPPANSDDYIDAIVRLCREDSVKAVFVGSEEELSPLSDQAQMIERESGALVVADREAISVGRDKWKTFQYMKKHGLACAASALPEDRDKFVHDFGFPLVVKPREGHG